MWNHQGILFISSSMQKKTFFLLYRGTCMWTIHVFLVIMLCTNLYCYQNKCFSTRWCTFGVSLKQKSNEINWRHWQSVVSGFDLNFHARENSEWHPAVTKHSRRYCLKFILKELFSDVLLTTDDKNKTCVEKCVSPSFPTTSDPCIKTWYPLSVFIYTTFVWNVMCYVNKVSLV